jgi:CRP-like cAMP-binding protein
VVLPGDLVSPTGLLERQFSFSIQAVTDVRSCFLPFAEVRARMRDNPALFDIWLRLTAAEQRDADKRLVDLGQRAAQERIAALSAQAQHLRRRPRYGENRRPSRTAAHGRDQIVCVSGCASISRLSRRWLRAVAWSRPARTPR